jgi:uncharacterized membrane protein YhaH (DUF805 family)
MDWKHYLFGFTGRINRGKYWLYIAIAIPVLLGLFVALYAYSMSFPGAYENGGPTPWPSDPLGIVGAIAWFAALAALFVSGIAIIVKRLHDRDKAWWWIVPFYVVPNLLYGAAQYLTEVSQPAVGETPFLLQYASLALTIWAFVELGILRGSDGANRFGPDPQA